MCKIFGRVVTPNGGGGPPLHGRIRPEDTDPRRTETGGSGSSVVLYPSRSFWTSYYLRCLSLPVLVRLVSIVLPTRSFYVNWDNPESFVMGLRTPKPYDS